MRFELRPSFFETPAAPAPQERGNGLKRLSGLLLGGGNVGENAHDVAFLDDQQFLTIELDLGAGPFAEQHAVSNLEIDQNPLADIVTAARTNGCPFDMRGLFLGS